LHLVIKAAFGQLFLWGSISLQPVQLPASAGPAEMQVYLKWPFVSRFMVWLLLNMVAITAGLHDA
jgi:hypothetical protein